MASAALMIAGRASYTRAITASLAALAPLARLPQLPWRLLALNAMFYLDPYLTSAEYAAALDEAVAAATAEHRRWAGQSIAADSSGAATSAPRATLYRDLFAQAVATAQPARLLLAQHAAEMAEALPDDQLAAALHVGRLALPPDALPLTPGPPAPPDPDPALLVERLSRARLCGRIAPDRFVAGLLVVHAARRAYELTSPGDPAPLALAARLLAALPDHPAMMRHIPQRLCVAQPHALVRRALDSGDPQAILAVEAGLVEAEALTTGPQLLLLAALGKSVVGSQ